MKIKVAQRLKLHVAWLKGGDVLERLKNKFKLKEDGFQNVRTEERLKNRLFELIPVQTYPGGFDIADAFRKGKNGLFCVGISNAGPTIGITYWWHG